MLMFSDSVLPNWPAKMSDHGDINVDAKRGAHVGTMDQREQAPT